MFPATSPYVIAVGGTQVTFFFCKILDLIIFWSADILDLNNFIGY